jgi:hypothetical protein
VCVCVCSRSRTRGTKPGDLCHVQDAQRVSKRTISDWFSIHFSVFARIHTHAHTRARARTHTHTHTRKHTHIHTTHTHTNRNGFITARRRMDGGRRNRPALSCRPSGHIPTLLSLSLSISLPLSRSFPPMRPRTQKSQNACQSVLLCISAVV